jgi:hypothetical protein
LETAEADMPNSLAISLMVTASKFILFYSISSTAYQRPIVTIASVYIKIKCNKINPDARPAKYLF